MKINIIFLSFILFCRVSKNVTQPKNIGKFDFLQNFNNKNMQEKIVLLTLTAPNF